VTDKFDLYHILVLKPLVNIICLNEGSKMLSGVLGSKQTAYHHSLCQLIDIFEEKNKKLFLQIWKNYNTQSCSNSPYYSMQMKNFQQVNVCTVHLQKCSWFEETNC
jgi:hypothetical protein